jgi:glycosyltransferase involved in cell wall biosynthesis
MACVTVITPTVPGREGLLEECEASVAAQTVPADHLVAVDDAREGPAAVRNRLAALAEADWLLPLDDDDLLDPDALEVLLAQTGGADIIYPWCRVEGSDWVPNRWFDTADLVEAHEGERLNYIPVTALIRRSLWAELGGMRSVEFEDYDLWTRAVEAGARFRCVPEVLWTYRVGEWQHRNPS